MTAQGSGSSYHGPPTNESRSPTPPGRLGLRPRGRPGPDHHRRGWLGADPDADRSGPDPDGDPRPARRRAAPGIRVLAGAVPGQGPGRWRSLRVESPGLRPADARGDPVLPSLSGGISPRAL